VSEERPPFPPFSVDTAIEKVRKAEDAWNTRQPQTVALAYTEDSVWRNRAEFLSGRAEIVDFLTRKWNRELDYRLIKELWTFVTTASPFASPMSGMTTAEIGSGATATKTGSSLRTA
jgi:nuclear transport factor 2 (NTF2) superfamily protein